MTFNGKQESEYYEAATKSIQDSDRKIREIRNLDYAKACREYFTGILNSERATENNLEPQHGVTPCKLDSALKNGLPALGYAPQWALPTDCVHWEYPQESLIVCNEGSGEECNLYCKDTASKVTKDQEANLLRGVSDFYKNLQTACQTVLSSANLGGANYPSQRGTALNTDFSSNGAGSTPDLTKNPIDWAHWEKTYPGLLALPNCEDTQKKLNPIAKRIFGCQEDQEDVVTSRKTVTHESKDLPYDFSLPCVTTAAKEREIRKESTSTSSRTRKANDKSDKSRVNVAIRKSDVEDNLVKNETRTSGVNSSNNYWDDYVDMSGQYPGHSRPPVGTPPPQNVWNHLTMTQGQGKNNSGNRGNVGSVGGGGSVPPTHDSLQRSYERVQSDLSYILSEVSGMNMHPTALSGASLNSAGFYTHPSIARASHLTSQLAPQLAHTQAPPTWHTPTVPSKNVTAQNAPGNPLYSLQMLVDNRQNQNQYRNSPGSQNTLDLSSTSEIAENYSRMTQDIPISLTARNVDKGSRNGNIISPPIPLNGETSSDSGISSSVPTPNSLGEPVSLSTKELTSTPKITVKNFESNLKGVANLHDKIDNFAQKVINLPPSVTIERVMSNIDKKDSEQPIKVADTLSVIAQVPRNVMPVIVNLTSRMDKDTVDSPMRESSSERERKIDDATSVRSPKNMPKRGKKGVDSLLEKLEGGNKKLGSTENIGSVIVTPVEEKQDSSSVKSMSPERQKSKSPTREDDVVSPAFSNDDSNDNTKQRRKRKLEKPVRLSKDSKTEVEDMELEPTEPREPRICEPILEEISPRSPIPLVSSDTTTNAMTMTTTATTTATTTITTISCSQPINADTRIEDRTKNEETNDDIEEDDDENEENADEASKTRVGGKKNSENVETTKIEENEPIKRRRSSEGPATNQTPTSQRTRRKSSDDVSELSKVTSPRGVNNPFNEVESELEKMFAGIVENEETEDIEKGTNDTSKDIVSNEIKRSKKKKDDNEPKMEIDDATTIDDKCTSETSTNPTDVTSSTASTKVNASKRGKKGKSRGGKRKISRSVDNVWTGAGDDPTTMKDNKKRRGSKGVKKIIETPTKKTKNKNLKTEGVREIAYDSGSNASSIRSRGPVVHVEGPRDSPLSVQVVNAPREDEEEKNKEKRKSVGNGNAGRSKRLSHQNDLDYRGKVSRAGLFSSTLSSRYDAHTTDSTWVCVFCKQGPHSIVPGDPLRPHPNLAGPHIAPGTYTVPAGVLSDLFGPYLIGKERLEESILSADEQEITTEQKKGSKNKRSLRYAGLADQFSAKMGKKKRNSIECIVTGAFTGMTLLPGDEQRWEVWLHEQCALWAAGVYMAGGRVTGLQEAVWDATKSICGSCGLGGANIGCVKRGCKAVTHYPCALTKGWLLDTNQYIPKCNLHRVT